MSLHWSQKSLALALTIKLALVAQLAASLMSLPDGIEHILGFVPKSGFQCERDGYFGDIENECRIFHLCQKSVSSTGRLEWRHWTYACGNQTMFNQLTLTCAFVDEAIPCKHASQFQYLNEVIHRPREPFLTDADVTSGFSYYTNRVMSDGARARAFQDSQLMAQIGGAPVGSEQHQFENSDNRLKELPPAVADHELQLHQAFQEAFQETNFAPLASHQQHQQEQGAFSNSISMGAHQGEQSQLSPFVVSSEQPSIWLANQPSQQEQQLQLANEAPPAPVAGNDRARAPQRTSLASQLVAATDSSQNANSFTFTYATDHTFGGRSDSLQAPHLASWPHESGQFLAPPAPLPVASTQLPPTTTATAGATATTTTTARAAEAAATSTVATASADLATTTTTLASQTAAGDRLLGLAPRAQQVASTTTLASRQTFPTTTLGSAGSTLAAATTTTAASTTTTAAAATTTTTLAATTTAATNGTANGTSQQQQQQQQPTTTLQPATSTAGRAVNLPISARSSGQTRRRQANLRSSGFESSRLTKKQVAQQAGELAGQLQKRASSDQGALVMRNQRLHSNRVKRLNRSPKLEAEATSQRRRRLSDQLELAESLLLDITAANRRRV